MKASDIIIFLKTRLPEFTDLFNDVFSISSLTRSGSTVTAVTTTAHGMTTNDIVHISDALSPNPLASLRIATPSEKQEIIDYLKSKGREYQSLLPASVNIAMAETTNNHDQTEVWFDNVEISGASEADYNGTHRLLRVQNRKNFSYQVDGSPTSPATGSPILLENLAFGYNGLYEVTVSDATTFTYEITGTPGSPAQGSPKAKTNPRISGALSPQRAINSYTKKATNKLWAFVVLGDVITNKDRAVLTDATSTNVPGVDYRTRQIHPFSIYVFTPSTDTISGRSQRDLMEDVSVFLAKSLLGAIFPSGFTDSTQFKVTPLGHGVFADDNSYLIYKFDYEIVYDIVFEDTIDPGPNVAFRDIPLNFLKFFADDDEVIMSTSVDLDDEPLT